MMRLSRLDLIRYGKFTDKALAFGEKAPGKPDFHIIYGPNEAGKSTALAAYLDFLFGIDRKTPYGFLHSRDNLRIGADLLINQSSSAFFRTKDGLLDDRGKPVPDALLSGALNGLDRAAYHSMFSLDKTTLEKGGEDILASQGDLGQLLYSASSGLSGLAQILSGLEEKAAEFHRPRARKSELATLKAELDQLETERRERDIVASDYAHLATERKNAETHYEFLRQRRRETEAERERLATILAALPHFDRLIRQETERRRFADLPDAPPEWEDDYQELTLNAVELEQTLLLHEARLRQLTKEISETMIDEAALGLAPALKAANGFQARYRTAEEDLPNRRNDLAAQDRNIALILARLGRAGETYPERLLPLPGLALDLHDMIRNYSGVERQYSALQQEWRAAIEAKNALKAKMQLFDCDVIPLYAALEAVRNSDFAARKNLGQDELDQKRADFANALIPLSPWTGDFDSLARLTIPEKNDLEDRKKALAEADVKIAQTEKNILDRKKEQRALDAEEQAITTENPIIGEDPARLRAERNAAWAAYRHNSTRENAETFENLLAKDDSLAEARLSFANDVARLKEISRRRILLQSDQTALEKELADAILAKTKIAALIDAFIRRISPLLPADLGPDALMRWLQQRDDALIAGRAMREAALRLEQAERREESLKQALIAALDKARIAYPPDDSIDALRLRAEEAIRQNEAQRKQTDDLVKAEEETQRRAKQRDQAQDALDQWRARWDQACRKSWFGQDETPPDIATVSDILAQLEKLAPTLDKRADLAQRIHDMEENQAEFIERLNSFAAFLHMEKKDVPPLALWEQIQERAEQARQVQDFVLKKQNEVRQEQGKLSECQAKMAALEQRKHKMTAFFLVEDFVGVKSKLDDLSKRRALDENIRETSELLCAMTKMLDLSDAKALLDGQNRTRLEEDRARLAEELEEQNRNVESASIVLNDAKSRIDAIGGDESVALLAERRRTLLLEIEEKANRYLRLKIGIAATEQALSRYREQRRSAMLDRASAMFSKISCAAYQGLRAEAGKGGEKLIAISAEGGSKQAAELSEGTRHQLYLALRMAGYHEYAKLKGPVPFIADDIMETFDDDRSVEVFRLLEQMSSIGQVIYLTHHRHLCDIAVKHCPAAQIHKL